MNGIHDCGGMHGLGPLPFEENEPKFRGDHERTIFGVNMLLLLSGAYFADEHRHSMEKITAVHWLGSPYYEHWIDGFEQIMIEKGYLTPEEIATGRVDPAIPVPALGYIEPKDVHAIATTNHPVTGEAAGPPQYKVGDRIRAKNWNPRTHTRLPRYIRGHVGTIASYTDAFLYADTRAHGGGNNPQHTYSVRFEGEELWGPDAGPKDAVYIDLYETYIEAA